ncbi:MAG: ATP-binding protein [Lachnospiraceae bacterium]|nr:ATP-binding protein [Lachnospiraceae bacterium]MEE0862365.1 ATP-binding protein [Lachnospiraceae bacterium]
MISTNRLMLYKDFVYNDIFYGIANIISASLNGEDIISEDIVNKAYECVNKLIEVTDTYGLEGNLYHSFLTFLLVNNENAFSISCEKIGNREGSINSIAKNDLEIFKGLFDVDLCKLDEKLGTKCFSFLVDYKHKDGNSKVFNRRVRDSICNLAKELADALNVDAFYDKLVEFYKATGVGKLGLNKAFRIDMDENDKAVLMPVTSIEHVYLDDLIGYEIQKKKLIDNTEDFVSGRPANNALLYGDSGTGKSSSIKAILNEYYDRGLRMIEVYKHQFQELSKIIEQVKDRNYKFIVYMDDLSFEDYEIEYKYLKAIIEGGLSKKPNNVLIYATSNRRHLVREKWQDKEDRDQDLHTNDTVQEKLSLVNRFGVTICYQKPNKKEFQEIIRVLAKRHNIVMDENELLLKANAWELSHGGISGRTAQQFINYIVGQYS